MTSVIEYEDSILMHGFLNKASLVIAIPLLWAFIAKKYVCGYDDYVESRPAIVTALVWN